MNNPWELIVIQPMVNVLLVLSHYLFSSPGLAVIVLTIVVNIVILPLTLKQTRSSKAMQEMQPKLVELQKKYAKDKQKLAQEQKRLYREAGMSPAGCILPMLVQMPIWIALYQAIVRVLAASPEDFLSLSRFLYSWPVNFQSLPLQNRFLWFNLNSPDTLLILPVLVGATMWVQQKMSTPNYTDPKQQSQNQITLWMMPLMFGFFTLNFPSGLALFWVISSIVRIAIQYFVTGWGGLLPEKRTPSQVMAKKNE
jgi:YidC/Oxa1 family membrane protein insertase